MEYSPEPGCWPLCGQIFLLVSGVQFVLQLAQGKPHWPLPLAPIAALALLSFSTDRMVPSASPMPAGGSASRCCSVALVYRWVALAMSIWWVCQYIPERERIWLLALLGLWVFVWAGWQRSREALLFSAAYTLVALVLFWLPLLEAPRVYWPNLMVILILLAQRQFARRLPERYPLGPEVHTAVILIGGLSLWRFLSLWVLEQQPAGILPHGQLVHAGAGVLYRGHRAAGTDVSLAGPGRARLRPGPRGDLRRVEAAKRSTAS